jgi:hypothetical protein
MKKMKVPAMLQSKLALRYEMNPRQSYQCRQVTHPALTGTMPHIYSNASLQHLKKFQLDPSISGK